MTSCTRRVARRCTKSGTGDATANCLDNLTASLGQFRVPAATVTIAFNVFMRVDIEPGFQAADRFAVETWEGQVLQMDLL
jgi:uncharacterized protein YcgI (DUF1989 family)